MMIAEFEKEKSRSSLEDGSQERLLVVRDTNTSEDSSYG